MYLFLGILAWLGFMAGLAVHVSSFFPWGCTMDQAWGLHLLAFGLFAAAIAKARAEGDTTSQGVWLRGPRPLQALFQFTFFYALLNFAIFFFTLVGNDKVVRDGGQRYVVKGAQKVLLSPDRVHEHERKILRGFSGHWQMFFLGAALILCWPPPAASRRPPGERD